MAKERAVLACTACGHHVGQWAGRCPGCGSWGTIEQTLGAPGAATVESLDGVAGDDERLPTGLDGIDRVLGGGLVTGSVVLVAGEPGIGKSTLLLQMAANLTGGGRTCLYASGEESRGQVAGRARRLGLPPGAAS